MRAKQLLIVFVIAALLPLLEWIIPYDLGLADALRPVFILTLLGLGLNVITGFTGLLSLGVGAFMAIGAYTYAILSCDIFPFQLGFWLSLIGAMMIGAGSGVMLGLPTLRLRGDYLAIVTLGFGEIVQDVLRNLETITRGTQGINPLPGPSFLGFVIGTENSVMWYYLLLGLLGLSVLLVCNLELSRIGRNWISIREDELAASCMGIPVVKSKLVAFALAAALCSMSGALWASFLGSSGEPGNYDFQISILALCMVIVGGMGSVKGVIFGALIMVGFNSILLVRVTNYLTNSGLTQVGSVFSSPNNWKYLIFGLALVIMMRFKPEGLWPSKRVKEEFAHSA